ncbi:hypothetical protein B5E80_19045 [Flavonifractor sp. An135]|nr:DUF3102 domain-containing protein [Flavonifractor sp. An135]OUQ16325.1 hypothetical protein B5E80_19045 [Flavonifractor sp. An135]
MGKPDLGRLIAQTMAQPAEGRTIEAITGDILEAKRTGGEAILTIGRCLIEAKDLLRHGEWLPWLNEQVELSERTAQKFMKLAREWSNPNTLADLGASKALMLLALPAEERETFIEEHNVIDMSARQLEAAIKERDEARQAQAKLEEDMRLLNIRLEGSREDREQAVQDVARLEAELAELKARPVEVAVETVVDQEAIDKAKDEARAEMQAKLDKAKEAAAKAKRRQEEAEAAAKLAETMFQDAERARKNAVLAADEDMAAFKVLFQQAQENANKLRGILLKLRAREDPAAAQGVEKALKALAEAIGRCVE